MKLNERATFCNDIVIASSAFDTFELLLAPRIAVKGLLLLLHTQTAMDDSPTGRWSVYTLSLRRTFSSSIQFNFHQLILLYFSIRRQTESNNNQMKICNLFHNFILIALFKFIYVILFDFNNNSFRFFAFRKMCNFSFFYSI